ncbi:DUF3616 domain-containing protein [Zavarzinia sp.]|uniref:DUF3616 domain-containing protein n=1 Tax=Zavarzinia sp. TaxID=2027920 RepID=UPI0035687BCF
MNNLKLGLAAVLLCCPATIARAADTPLDGKPLTVEGKIEGKDAAISTDVSGIACQPAKGGAARKCYLVDDEVRYAHAVTLTADTLAASGAKVTLVPEPAGQGALGVALDRQGTRCSGEPDKPKQFDGEAVTFDGKFYYVVGSHGCSRKSKVFHLSSYTIARFPADAEDGEMATLSFRLAEVLRQTPGTEVAYGKDLNGTSGGMNIEGMVALGRDLVFGLRAPVVDGRAGATLLRVRAAPLFAPGDAPYAGPPAETFVLDLGEGAGIRDLAPLGKDRFLVLSGPAADSDASVPFALWSYKPGDPHGPRHLAELKSVPGEDNEPGKAEAVWLLSRHGKKLDIVVLFDNVQNGGPRLYTVDD